MTIVGGNFMNYQLDFTGKNILITGASGGLGSAISEGFASLGGTVILVDIYEESLKKTADAIKDQGGKCALIQADLTKEEDLDRIIDTVKRDFGHLDVLMNNAGIGHRIQSVDVSKKQWNDVINLNMNVPFILSAKVVQEFMIPQNKGKIVNTASMGGFSGIPASAAYSTSKGGLLQMSRSLASEWAKYNIQVNCICPGYIETGLLKDAMNNEAWKKVLTIRTPAGRIGQPEEVVGAALFLASEMANYITGSYIQIDGGCYASGF